MRLGTVLATPALPLHVDSADYHRYARAVAERHHYPKSTAPAGGPTAYRPPGYPLFLAAVYATAGEVTGARTGPARGVQAGLGTIVVALIGLLGWRLWGRRVGLVALALAAFYPPLILLGSALVSEVLLLPLELGALACVLEHRRSGRREWLLATGVLAGLATLTRPNAAVLLIPLALAASAGGPGISRRRLRSPAIVLVSAALTIAPWTVRNAIVMDAFVPVSTQAGLTLAGTYNDTARSGPLYPALWLEPALDPEYMALARRTDGRETSIERIWRRRALRYMREHPGYVVQVMFWNASRILHLSAWRPNAHLEAAAMGLPGWLADAGMFSFYPIALLALAGALTGAARAAPRFVWLFPLLMASTIVVVGYIRFRAPIDPFLLLLAALAINRTWERRARAPRPRPG